MLKSKEYSYLETLNQQQRMAVVTLDGPLLVLSGAGTGKTKVLTSRIAHLLVTGKTKPWNIMAVTFTNKAAREMKERVAEIIGPSSEQILMGTFHSLGARMLRQHAQLVGLKNNFTIIDTDDQIKLLKQILSFKDIDEKKWPPKFFVNIVNSWKDKGLTPSKITDEQIFLAYNIYGQEIQNQSSQALIREVYIEYQNRLIQSNLADFGDLLIHPLELLRTNSDVLNNWQSKITHILIDEYQDTNTAQYLWIRLLCNKNNDICCVGDDDQSIFGWRGAEVKNILGFDKDFDGAKIIRLEQNYRSTNKILDAANSLIKNNTNRLGKNLWTDLHEGNDLEITGLYNSKEEARFIGESVENHINEKRDLSQIAIMARTFSQLRVIEERFMLIGLPYKVVGTKFYERQEIRDALAYIRIICNSSDDLALERIINVPRRGIGLTSIKKLIIFARDNDIQLLKAAENVISNDKLNNSTKEKITQLVHQIIRWRKLKNEIKPMNLIDLVLEESGYYEMWQNEKNDDSEIRLENLKDFISSTSEFDTLEGFLQHISLMIDNDREKITGEVTLMTLHAAKGLEYEIVYLPGWEEGLFPSSRSIDDKGNDGLEEERRLAYVGITRAKKQLYISHSSNRMIHGLWMSSVPSRFLKELPNNLSTIRSDNFYQGESYNSEVDCYDLDQSQSPEYGPGWERMSNKSLEKSTIATEYKKIENSFKKNNQHEFIKGERVFHVKFGMGNVINSNGDNLEIMFDKAGNKKIKSNYVQKQ